MHFGLVTVLCRPAFSFKPFVARTRPGFYTLASRVGVTDCGKRDSYSKSSNGSAVSVFWGRIFFARLP